jgi:hypothetical protein
MENAPTLPSVAMKFLRPMRKEGVVFMAQG